MNEVNGFTIVSLRAKMDQALARESEGHEILNKAAIKYEKISFVQRVSFFIMIANLILLFPISLFVTWWTGAAIWISIACIIAIIYVFIAFKRLNKPVKKFIKEQEVFTRNLWGRSEQPAIAFIHKEYQFHEVWEVRVHFKEHGECFVAGEINPDDSMLEGVQMIDSTE